MKYTTLIIYFFAIVMINSGVEAIRKSKNG
jgi:hypothetical protein